MNSTIDLSQDLSDWVSATKGRAVQVPSTRRTRQVLQRIRPLLHERVSDVSLGPDDETLSVLSLLASDLNAEVEPSRRVLGEAEGAFTLLGAANIREDEYGEVGELLGRFAFICWRHSRYLNSPRESQQWLGLFEESLSRESVLRECFEYFLQTPAADYSSGLSSAFLGDSEDLLAVCALLRQGRNERPELLAESLPRIRRWIETHFRPSVFRDERDYFLAQINLSAGACFRWIGQRQLAAESYGEAAKLFARTVEPNTGKAEVDCCRLVLRYDEGRFDEVLAALPESATQTRFPWNGDSADP